MGKFIAINAYIKKEEKSQINLHSHLKKLEKKSKLNAKQVEGNKL